MKRLIILPLFLAMAAPALAGDFGSVFTRISAAFCKPVVEEDVEFYGGFLCTGYGELSVYRASGDQRVYEAYGLNPQNHCAAGQTFLGFNRIGDIVEWRLFGGRPVAAITQWFVSLNGSDTRYAHWVTVSKIEDHDSCRMALVDGNYPDADERARKLADDLALKFECATGMPEIMAPDAPVAAALLSGIPCSSQH
jgi:hypothetical protein